MRTLSRFALVVAIGGVASACSSDVARFTGSPFSNPFKSRSGGEPTMTGSVPPKAAAVRSAPVEAQPLAPPPAPAAPVYNRPPAPAPIAVAPVAQRKPAAPARAIASGPAGWTAQGGTPVTVRAGDNLNSIATRYGVPASAILEANGLKSAAQISPGRQIVIPVYNAGGVAGAPAKAAPVPQREAREAKLRFVQGPKGQEKPGGAKDRPRQAAAKPAESKADPKLAKAEPPKQAVKPEPAKQAAVKPEPQKTAAAQPAKPAALKAAEAPKPAQTEIVKAPVKEPEQTASIAPQATAYAPTPAAVAPGLGFRWPAKGRVIAGFGGSGGNEGINIALPEGTPVKAAEDGTVAYAGSEVKGYGKLVLIRHDNGYVSAYAHNGDINVKHGQKVKRGETIAKSGQTGNVTSPQLHFEIRKGASPIDPMPHLNGG